MFQSNQDEKKLRSVHKLVYFWLGHAKVQVSGCRFLALALFELGASLWPLLERDLGEDGAYPLDSVAYRTAVQWRSPILWLVLWSFAIPQFSSLKRFERRSARTLSCSRKPVNRSTCKQVGFGALQRSQSSSRKGSKSVRESDEEALEVEAGWHPVEKSSSKRALWWCHGRAHDR